MARPTELELKRTAHPTPDTWILHFDWATNPIPMNGPKANWRARNRVTANVKEIALRLAVAARIPEMARCEAQITWWVNTNRKRDVDNLGLLEKPIFDAVVIAGIVRDDTPDYMTKPRAVIRQIDTHSPIANPGFTLTVTRLEAIEEIEL